MSYAQNWTQKPQLNPSGRILGISKSLSSTSCSCEHGRSGRPQTSTTNKIDTTSACCKIDSPMSAVESQDCGEKRRETEKNICRREVATFEKARLTCWKSFEMEFESIVPWWRQGATRISPTNEVFGFFCYRKGEACTRCLLSPTDNAGISHKASRHSRGTHSLHSVRTSTAFPTFLPLLAGREPGQRRWSKHSKSARRQCSALFRCCLPSAPC